MIRHRLAAVLSAVVLSGALASCAMAPEVVPSTKTKTCSCGESDFAKPPPEPGTISSFEAAPADDERKMPE